MLAEFELALFRRNDKIMSGDVSQRLINNSFKGRR